MADVVPAQNATSASGTLKDSIISGRYGKIEVREIGSANRHIAVLKLLVLYTFNLSTGSPGIGAPSIVNCWTGSLRLLKVRGDMLAFPTTKRTMYEGRFEARSRQPEDGSSVASA
jgi:hypothetical protein